MIASDGSVAKLRLTIPGAGSAIAWLGGPPSGIVLALLCLGAFAIRQIRRV